MRKCLSAAVAVATLGLPSFALTAIGLVVAGPAFGSTLTGVVTSASGPVAGAFVAATGPNGGAGAVSDSSGAYTMTLPDGTYRLAANAPGYAAAILPSVSVSGATTQNAPLTASGSTLAPLPIFGGSPTGMAADGTPGVFYLSGGNVGDLFRSVDYGATWTPVTVASDDPTNGLSGAASPRLVSTSGFPGEVAVSIPTPAGVVLPAGQSLGASAVLYSTDYGVTWHVVGNTPRTATGQNAVLKLMWGHAGSTSVLVALVGSSPGGPATSMYVADMTASSPTFVQMTSPYAPAEQPIAVGDGADEPWLATVDSDGTLSVYPLVAQATAPAAYTTQSGFPTDPVAVGIGGATAAGVPPAGVVVMSSGAVTMSVKGAADTSYPAPGTPAACSPPGMSISPNASVAPNTGGSYGAAWIDGCWVLDTAGTITAEPFAPNGAAIDAGYNATGSSAGSDAVVLQNAGGSRGVTKVAASTGGFPSGPASSTAEAQPGTDPGSGGMSLDGFTGASVFQTTFGPTGSGQVASATDAGGFASADGGTTFQPATYDESPSVAWWQGASGNWLLFGLNTFSGSNTVTGFLNWTSTTLPVGGTGNGNVSGSSSTALGASSDSYVQAIAGVPGQDTAFLDLAQGGNQSGSSRPGVVRRVTVAAGPSFSNVTAIGDGVITEPGALAYCPTAGSASSLQDVLLVNSGSGSGGVTLFRVIGATTASPTVTQVATVPGTPMYPGQPSLQADCASGTVLAAEGGMSKTLLESTDGGQTFTSVSTPAQDGINAVAITPGTLGQSIEIGDGGGFIYASNDGGATWPFVENDPGTGVNLGAAENASGGLHDFVAGSASPSTSDPNYEALLDPPASPLTRGADLIAGPGEFAGNLTAPAAKPTAPKITKFSLTNTRFAATSKPTAISAKRKPGPKRGTTFRYTLSEAATVAIAIARAVPGITVGKGKSKRCVALGNHKAARAAKKCTAYALAGILTRRSKQGANNLPFSGRIGQRALEPANYLATVTARVGTGPVSRTRTATFTVIKG